MEKKENKENKDNNEINEQNKDDRSFSRQAKEEMISRINSPDKGKACLYGMLLCANVLSRDEITLMTELAAAAKFFRFNVEKIIGRGAVTERVTERGGDAVMYQLSVERAEDRAALLDCFGIGEGRKRLRENYPKPSLCPQMTAGMFLACGSISDPNKAYHMEFVMPDLELCNFLGLMLIEKYDMLAKNVERKNHQLLYFKESDNIMDMLALMGATNCYFDFFHVRQLKDVRNKVNRGMNCQNANANKSDRAAQRVIADIELIDEKRGLYTLPEPLRDIAVLRYENPDFNLAQLGAALKPPISRSGANKRLQKLSAIADEIRSME